MSGFPSLSFQNRTNERINKICHFHVIRCDIDFWDSDDPISREELLRRVRGLDGLYCLLTEKVDAELLEAAGEYCMCVNH